MRVNRRLIWLTRLALLTAFHVCSASTLRAQQLPAGEPRVETVLLPGMTVWITDATGREEKTRITRVSTDVLTAIVDDDVRHLRAADVTRVRVRRSDSLIDGALIGAGTAVGSGL